MSESIQQKGSLNGGGLDGENKLRAKKMNHK